MGQTNVTNAMLATFLLDKIQAKLAIFLHKALSGLHSSCLCLPNSSAFCARNTNVQLGKHITILLKQNVSSTSIWIVFFWGACGAGKLKFIASALLFLNFPPNWRDWHFWCAILWEVILVANLRGLKLEFPIFHQQTLKIIWWEIKC